MDETRISGRLKNIFREKGYGFITRDDHEDDVFLHRSAMRSADWERLSDGCKLTFTVANDRGRGPRAANIEHA